MWHEQVPYWGLKDIRARCTKFCFRFNLTPGEFGLVFRKLTEILVSKTDNALYRNTEVRSCNNCCGGRAISITYCECVFVALGIQQAMRMRRFVICDLLCSTICFTLYLINDAIFNKKKLLNIKCTFWVYLQVLSETFLILRRNERDVIKNVNYSSCKMPLFLSGFNETWTLSTYFRKMLIYIKFHGNPSSGRRVVPRGLTDRQTSRHDEANSRLLQFVWTGLTIREYRLNQGFGNAFQE